MCKRVTFVQTGVEDEERTGVVTFSERRDDIRSWGDGRCYTPYAESVLEPNRAWHLCGKVWQFNLHMGAVTTWNKLDLWSYINTSETKPSPEVQDSDFATLFPCKAVPWLKRLVAGLSQRRPGFAPGPIHVAFVMDKVARFSPSSSVSPVNIIPPLLHIHLSPPNEVCDSSDKAAHYHHLGPKLGTSFLTRHFGWKQNK
jgi:hypothetical protein